MSSSVNTPWSRKLSRPKLSAGLLPMTALKFSPGSFYLATPVKCLRSATGIHNKKSIIMYRILVATIGILFELKSEFNGMIGLSTCQK